MANEVKELAKQSADATNDISSRVGVIQRDANAAIESIEEIHSIIGKINDFQTTIAAAVEEHHSTTNTVQHDIEAAATGTKDIALNIDQVAEYAAGTTEGATLSTQEAGNLANMAAELQEIVRQFRV